MATWQSHRADLERIRTICTAPGGPRFVEAAEGSSASSLGQTEIDVLVRKLAIRWVAYGEDPRFRSLRIAFFDKGTLMASTRKGLMYAETPPGTLIPSLDRNDFPSGEYYRHLEGNWYLFRFVSN